MWLHDSRPESSIRLMALVLATLELHADRRVAMVHLDQDMIAATGAQPGDSEGLIDFPRSIAGVEAVALFRQLEDGRWKASLRSRGAVNVERVARLRGGGGHQNAAGFTAGQDDDLETLRAELVEALSAALAQAPSESDSAKPSEDHG
jgi:phosphoesterase RecJ-like protein